MTREQIFLYAADCSRQALCVSARQEAQRHWMRRIYEEAFASTDLRPNEIREIVEDGWRYGTRTIREIF
jgi:hypothetical protein